MIAVKNDCALSYVTKLVVKPILDTPGKKDPGKFVADPLPPPAVMW